MLGWLWGRRESAPDAECRVRFGAHEFACRKGKTLLDAALDAGVPMNYSCQVGACGTCRCRVLSGSFRTLKRLDYLLSAEETTSGVTLACQTLPSTDLVLEQGGVTQPATLVSCLELGDGVVEVRLRPDQRVVYELGQFVELGVSTDLVRPLSMVDLGNLPDGELAFHVKLRSRGALSDILRGQVGRSGLEVRVSAAFGHVGGVARGSYERVLCVAGGSGLGVCASVARSMLSLGRTARCDFVSVSRSGSSGYHERLVERLRFERRAASLQRTRYTELIEQDAAAVARVRAELAEHPDTLGVLCGSPLLVERGRVLLERAGLAQNRVWEIPFSRETEERPKSMAQTELGA